MGQTFAEKAKKEKKEKKRTLLLFSFSRDECARQAQSLFSKINAKMRCCTLQVTTGANALYIHQKMYAKAGKVVKTTIL